MSELFNSITTIISKHKFNDDNYTEINKTKAMLKRELNPEDSKAKLGLETFIDIVSILSTEEKIEIFNLLKTVFPKEENIVPQIKVRKKVIVGDTNKVIEEKESKEITTDNVNDRYSKNYVFDEGDFIDEPIGRMYSIGLPTSNSKLPNGDIKRTRKDYTVPSYAFRSIYE